MIEPPILIRPGAHALQRALTQFPVVALIGPRQVGKTSLARAIAAQHPGARLLDLERPSDLAKLTDAETYLESLSPHLVILDEVQLRPDLFPVLRALVDADRRPARFLLLGSAAPALIQQSSESLAGRITYIELTPFTLSEVGTASMRQLWERGGFPLSFMAADDDASLAWRESFIRSYLERDIPQLGIRVAAATLRRFWLMLAHAHGQLWNASSIAGSMGVSAPSVRHYLDILQDTFTVRALQPWHANLGKRLVKSPKVYLRDSGMLHALLNVPGWDDLMGHPILGASWEGFVIEQLLALAPEGTRPWFYRTAAGAEIDLLLELPGGRLQAIEIKHSAAPTVTRGFALALDDLGLDSGVVIAPVTEGYPLNRRAQVLPAAQMTRIFAQ